MSRLLATLAITMALIIGAASLCASEGKKNAKPVLALGGKCPVCLAAGKTVSGREKYSSVYDGYKYLFPSKKQKRMFDADPAKYAVQDHGNCIVCKIEMNKTVKGKPKIFAVHNRKIYLFVNDKIKKMFTSNPKKYTGEAKMLKGAGSGTTRE